MDERRFYRIGVEGRIRAGEEITFMATKSLITGFGPMEITAAYVAAPGNVGRSVVTDVQPPERLKQLGREFIKQLGNKTLKDASMEDNLLIHQNEGRGQL